MTASDPNSHATRFVALEQADFQRLEHAGYLRGLVQLKGLMLHTLMDNWSLRKTFTWCPERGSNPHGLRRGILSPYRTQRIT